MPSTPTEKPLFLTAVCGFYKAMKGIEGRTIEIAGGNVSGISSDDGLNGTVTSGTGITISGGTLYVLAGGDGADANSQTSYGGILFSGGRIFGNYFHREIRLLH